MLGTDAFQSLLVAPATRRELSRLLRDHPAVGALRMTRPEEPGRPLRIDAEFVDGPSGTPLPGLRIFLFQAAADGRYAPEAAAAGEGERNARLFAWLVTDEAGRITLDTILPGTYGEAPPHFHMALLPRGAAAPERLARRLYVDLGDTPVHPEIRSDAADGVAWIVPAARRAGEDGLTATCRLTVHR